MALTRALYYPSIDFPSESWLKSSLLYWDSLETIVPQSVRRPYRSRTAEACVEAGVLNAHVVDPESPEVECLTDRVIQYLSTEEGIRSLIGNEEETRHGIYLEKMAPGLLRYLDDSFLIYSDKFSDILRHELAEYLESPKPGRTMRLGPGFSDYYMTLLAEEISQNTGACLLTSSPVNRQLLDVVRRDPHLGSAKSTPRRMNRPASNRLKEGVVADLLIEKINIDPSTPVQNVLDFKIKHSSELGKFRTKVASLASSVDSGTSYEQHQQTAQDIYSNDVKPALEDLKASLSDHGVRWSVDNLMRVGFFSMPPTAAPLALMGMSLPLALLVGVGVSLTCSTVLYNVDRRRILRENSYSYLFKVNEQLVRRQG